MLETENHLGGVEFHVLFVENAVLTEMIMLKNSRRKLNLWTLTIVNLSCPRTKSPPFIRSRMKINLSGVWKAYVMQTIKGQSS